ncbi:hypothetical protein [Flavobacterium sp.]|uniref:hypothetical protein n=1 Tax=Flavobacterium sp. TaxID=239 RepID=UPI00260EB2EE|nr:hypothetical protein [Flavobacterium sp.]
MASTSEVGHNKNAANFNALAQILQEMGPLYNPSNANITLENFSPIQTTLATAMSNLNEKKPIYTNAVADREIAMASMSKKSSLVLNSFKSLRVSATDKENVTTLVSKIRGYRKPKKVNPDTSDEKTISTAQLSFDSRIANLDALIQFISSHPEYMPNEEEIKTASLQSYNNELKGLTQTVNAASNSLLTARKQRNDLLYHNSENIIDLVREIRSYLKSLGDTGKPYYKAAVRLKFRDMN